MPSSVVIPAGQCNAVFDLTIVNNTLLDGDQNATITAAATNYRSGQATILVHNNNTATLTVTLPATANKGAGTLVNAGLVSVSSTVAIDYPVSLDLQRPFKVDRSGHRYHSHRPNVGGVQFEYRSKITLLMDRKMSVLPRMSPIGPTDRPR